MLAFPAGFKIYLAVEPVDMRKQFNGLWALASERLREDPRRGAVFAFTNKPRDRLKLGQAAVLGRHRSLDPGQTPGEGTLQLAGRFRRDQAEPHPRGAHHAAGGYRPEKRYGKAWYERQ